MRLKLSLLLVFMVTFSWSQTTKTFSTSGTFAVPAGVASVNAQAWGGGGSGGGASGAGLLLGRGAAGGGGGAYVSATLSVNSGQILNAEVAGQTSGTSGGNGTSGGFSTITGYESSFLAAGGSGGAANNAGGTPLGGNGGLVSNSAGTIRFAGLNGVQGNSWSLLSLLLTSGAGGAGANFGGAGGAAVGSLILGTAPGNAGIAPGGGGSGAINSALGTAQAGGAGGAGQVIITYTCPTYTITGTTASNVCAIGSNESIVTLASSASSLPVGSYVVTYNRSNPAATGLTANMTVSSAGTATFIATGFTAVGNSTIVITKITSQSCSSTITTNNTATVIVSPATVGGAISGGTTINAGSTSGLLTLSGHTGSVVKWQSSVSPFTTWADIANTNTTYTSGILNETTQFRAVVQSGTCSVVNSEPTTVTVNPRPTITLASSAISRCNTNDGSASQISLDYTGTTENPTTYSIAWNSSPSNTFVPVTDAALPANQIVINIPAGVASGTYTGTLTVKNANGAISSPGTSFSVTINEIPFITTSGTIASVCASANSQNTTLAYTGVTGNPISYSIDWNTIANSASLADQGPTSFVFASSGGIVNSIVVSPNVTPGTYIGIMSIYNGICSQSQFVSLTVVPETVGGAVSGGTTINVGSTSGLLTLSGHTGSVVKWQSSVSPFTTWADIANTNTTYTSGILNETTQFRAVVQSGTCSVVNSEPTTVTVNPRPTITLASSAISRCNTNDGSASQISLDYTGTTENPTTYSIAWNSSPSNTFVPVTDAALPANQIVINIPAGVASGTYTGTLTVKNANGAISSPGTSFSVTINEIPFITTSGTIASVCASANSQNTTLAYTGVTGNPISYSIDWNTIANSASLADQGPTSFVFASSGGIVNSIVVSPNVTPGTYIGIMSIYNGICSQSQFVSLTVVPETVGGAVSGGTTINVGSTSGLLTLSGHTGSVVKWQSSVSPFTTWADIANTNTTYTSGILNETTQFRAVVQSGTCSVVNSEPTTVTVNPRPTITLASSAISRCNTNDGSASQISLDYTGTTENPTTYSIVWNSSPSNTFVPVTDAALPANQIVINIPAGVASGTYTGTLTVKNANGAISSPGTSFSVTINEIPFITTSGTIASVCASANSQNTTLAYTGVTGNPISYSIDWNTIADQGPTSFVFASSGGIVNSIVVSPNVTPGTYIGIMSIYNGICSQSQFVSLTVVPETVGGAVSGGTTINVGSTSGLLTLSGHTGSVVKWQSSVSPFTTWADIANTNTTYTSGILNETTQFRAVVQSGTCSVVNSEPTTVTVNPRPTINLSETAEGLCLNGHQMNTILSYYGTTGNPVSYSIVWNSSPTNSFATVTDEVLPSSSITFDIPGGTASGTYTGTLTVKNAGGGTSIGKTFSLTLVDTPSITTTGTVNPVTTSSSNQTASLFYSASTGHPDSYSIDWDSAANTAQLADQDYTPFSFAPGGGSIETIAIPANVPAGTYSGVLIIDNGSCTQIQDISITINAAAPTIALSELTDNACSDGSQTTTLLSYNGTTGNPVTYSIVWDSSSPNDFETIIDAALPVSPITITVPAGTAVGTYRGTLTVKNAVSSSIGKVFNLTVNEKPNFLVDNDVTPTACSSTSMQYTTLAYSHVTGYPTSYYIDWDDTANAALLQDQPITPFEPERGYADLRTVEVSANAQAGDYSGTLYLLNDFSCSSSPIPVSMSIKPTPTAPVIASITQPTYEEPTGGVLLSGLPAGNWIIEVNPSGRLVTGSSQYAAITQLEEAEYTFTVTKDGVGCPSEPSEIVDIHGPYGEGGEGFKTKDSTDNTIAVTAVNKVININSTSQNIDKVFVYDTSGNLIYKKNKVGDSKLVIDNLRATNQILIVKAVLDDNTTKTKKVIY